MKLNYFNFREFGDEILLTNDLGFHCFLKRRYFDDVVNERIEQLPEEVSVELKEKFFLYDEADDLFASKVAEIYRSMRYYLFKATELHIFVMTNACNMSCVYCQAQDPAQEHRGIMNKETAMRAADIVLQTPSDSVIIEFQGGEPLLNYDVIRHTIEYVEMQKDTKNVSYTIVTNTILLTDEMIDFFAKNNVSVSTSLDGTEKIHNYNRPLRDGGKTFRKVSENIKKLRDAGISTGAIQTTTKKSLMDPKGVVSAYKEMELSQVFLRPLTPLGYAREHWDEIGYVAEEFLAFYRTALEEILDINKAGIRMCEGHASIFLRKILGNYSENYMELRSPCGAGVGQIAYYYDGNIFTCDEGRMLSEMGMDDFMLGNVWNDSYDSMMDSSRCKVTCQASVTESLPACTECVYQPYCGVCPVVTYAMEQNIYARKANGYRCSIYKGILDILFEFIHESKDVVEIFKTWI